MTEIKNPFANDEHFLETNGEGVSIDNEYLNKTQPQPPEPSIPNENNILPKTETSQQSTSNDIIMPPKPKYHIVDLYWLINPNLGKTEIPETHPHIAIISYNATFNNLRIALYQTTNKSFTDTTMILHNCIRLTSVNLFSETIEIIFNNLNEKDHSIKIIERLWTEQPNWKPNNTYIKYNSKEIVLHTTDKTTSQIYIYTFTDWQYNAFIRSMKCMLNGVFWTQSMLSTMHS